MNLQYTKLAGLEMTVLIMAPACTFASPVSLKTGTDKIDYLDLDRQRVRTHLSS